MLKSKQDSTTIRFLVLGFDPTEELIPPDLPPIDSYHASAILKRKRGVGGKACLVDQINTSHGTWHVRRSVTFRRVIRVYWIDVQIGVLLRIRWAKVFLRKEEHDKE